MPTDLCGAGTGSRGERFDQVVRAVVYLVRHPSPVHNRARALGRLAWRQFRKRIALGTIIFQWHGMAFEVFPESTSAGSVYYLDMPDWWEMNFLQRFLRPGDTAADVGANIGVYSLLAASVVGPGGSVVAFEPDPFNVERLRRQVLRNELSQVHIIEAAVADCDSELFLKAGKDTLSSIAMFPEEGIRVPAVRLDSYFECRRLPVYIKVDVEGYEESVVRGTSSIMRRGFPLVWQLELGGLGKHYGYSETYVAKILVSHGYHFCRYDAGDEKLVPVDDIDGGHQDNVLAVRDLDEVDARIRAIL
jgi:FkbM family methyltransferase